MWFKIDDGWWRGLKMRRLSKRRRVRACEQVVAAGLWSLAGAWSSDQLSDGRVPWDQIDEWDPDRVGTDLLVRSGFWTAADEGVVFHDWADWNPTRAEVERKRAEVRDRVQRYRKAKLATEQQVKDAGNALPPRVQRVSNSSPTRPDPTVREKEEQLPPRAARADSAIEPPLFDPPEPSTALVPVQRARRTGGLASIPQAAAFEEFWKAYPRRVGKGSARVAWAKCLKTGVTPEVVIQGAKRYADVTRDAETQYVKHPSTWLNAGCWDDEERVQTALERVRSADRRPNRDDTVAAWQALKPNASTARAIILDQGA